MFINFYFSLRERETIFGMEQHERILRVVPSRMLESKSVRNNDKYCELRNKKRKEMSKKEREQKKEEEKRDEQCLTFKVLFEFSGDLKTNTFQCIQMDSNNNVESHIYCPLQKRIKKERNLSSSHCCSCCNCCCCNCGRPQDEKQMLLNGSSETQKMELRKTSIKRNLTVKIEESS